MASLMHRNIHDKVDSRPAGGRHPDAHLEPSNSPIEERSSGGGEKAPKAQPSGLNHLRRGPGEHVRSAWGLLLLYLALTFWFAYSVHYSLPTPVTEPFDPKTGEPQFSEANVRKLTKHLSEDIGLRLVGTEQCDAAEKYLVREIKQLKEEAKRVAARGDIQGLPNFELWVQVEDGSHRFDFMSKVVMKTYTNMTNIIVRLSCGPECDDNAILLNAHFDTTLGSPGATDDGLGVGVLMEIIRIMSIQSAPKKNSVIFLFNGGEESLQDASHSFITNHILKDKVRAVINLEGCGSTGPEILFQANSRQMVEAYRRVPHPHGTVIGNDIFSTGVILSDTDFRQFVDHGNLTGLDMAVYKNSYIYHTELDLNENMEPGLPQHMGENTLALVRYLTEEVDLTEKFEKTSDVVFFDVLGWFFVSYSTEVATKIHLAIMGLTFLGVSLGASRPTLRSLTSILLSLAAGLLLPGIAAVILQTANKPLLWFTHEWLPFLFFGPSAVVGMFLVQYLLHNKHASTGANELSIFSGLQIFFTLLLAAATIHGLASGYMVAIYTLSTTIALFYNQRQQAAQVAIRSGKDSSALVFGVGFSTYFVASVIPSTYFIYSVFSMYDLVVPLLGRTGVSAPVDIVMAIIVGLTSFLVCPPILALSHRFGREALKKIILWLILVQVACLFYGVTFLKPYDKMHPKHIMAQHLRNLTSGETLVYVAHADPGPLYENYVMGVEELYGAKATFKHGAENPGDWYAIYPFSQFLDSYVIDTTPYIRSQTTNKTLGEAAWPLTELIKDAPKLIAENVSYDPETGLRRLTILCTHPRYILTVTSFDAALTWWSLSSGVPSTEMFHYVIRNAGGYLADGWRLDLEYKAPQGAEDRLKIEITSLETEGFAGDYERELEGSGEIAVMRKLVKAKPEFISLTYFSTVVSTFEL